MAVAAEALLRLRPSCSQKALEPKREFVDVGHAREAPCSGAFDGRSLQPFVLSPPPLTLHLLLFIFDCVCHD